jgi:imidazolonepropionase-like amidohydrolase
MSLTPTLTLFDVEAKKAGAPPDVEQKIVDKAVARLRAFSAAGGDVLFGTDVGYIYQFDTSEEYELMQRAGMTFPQILASLTINPARRFGFSDHSGHVAVKMDADLTVFRGDPGTDISAFSRVSYTIRAGKVIYRGPPQ